MSDNPLLNGDTITVHVAAKHILGLSHEYVCKMCQMGVFKSAHKPGVGRKAHWRLSRKEVMDHVKNSVKG